MMVDIPKWKVIVEEQKRERVKQKMIVSVRRQRKRDVIHVKKMNGKIVQLVWLMSHGNVFA